MADKDMDFDALMGMSDDDFMGASFAHEAVVPEQQDFQTAMGEDTLPAAPTEDPVLEAALAETPGTADAATPAEEDTLVGLSDAELDTVGSEPGSAPKAEDPPKTPEAGSEAEPGTQAQPEAGAKGEQAPANPETKAEEAFDYKAAFDQIMAPFKANGKTYKLETPEEAIQLMQKGANYTLKMQGLKPHLRVVRMLENNGLLDENKINFMIDLAKNDPQAIHKLLQDAKIDPMDMDMSQEQTYRPGNYSVSDAEMSFNDVLNDVMSSEHGQKTVATITKNWDEHSKDALFREPELLRIFSNQMESGVFDKISTEIERQRILGNLLNVSFVDAYRAVGDHLQQQGLLAPAPAPAPATPAPVPGQPMQQAPAQAQQQQQAPQVLETRVGTQKAGLQNSDKARAAAPSRQAPKPPAQAFNPLALTDEQILAITEPKL